MSHADDESVYQCLVVDSGPIIRLTGMSSLWRTAKHFYTVPAVLQEIRDAKARQHLETLPFTLTSREASREGMQAVVEFARQTGDYNSLSSVDIQVLGLLYDLEREGCRGDMSHIRTTPKRTLGLGKIESLGGPAVLDVESYTVEHPDNGEEIHDENQEVCDHFQDCPPTDTIVIAAESSAPSKTWAALLNPSVATVAPAACADATKDSFERMAISSTSDDEEESEVISSGGQFSDADEDNSIGSVSDEECDACILDPDEADRRNCDGGGDTFGLQSDFPSLAASLLLPYEGSDDDGRVGFRESHVSGDAELEEEKERKLLSLQPISKSGKLYNSFTKYGMLMKPKQRDTANAVTAPLKVPSTSNADTAIDDYRADKNQSRIIGGMGFAGQGDDVEDDGEGWIASPKDISSMKAVGSLDPSRSVPNMDSSAIAKTPSQGPALSQRAACTTTDFAMQNVILQMNMELLSVDGMKVRKLKNWVTRCGACFTVYTNSDNPGPLGRRLFCERCGSDVMQRIAASVDGKTGRLRLHLSKNYKHNLRGTKFSLPKPGSGNRFQGDLLLREDQLLMGAWSQKVKMRSGGKARDGAQSMFGRDIATNVGCHASAVNADDIRVGFGRRNPNAAKGRERRGKKKKSSDKACGLRRY